MTVELVSQQCGISPEIAIRELNSFLAAHGADTVEIRPSVADEEVVVDEIEEATKAHDYRQIHSSARQRLIDSIIDYQIAMKDASGEESVPDRHERVRMLRHAESIVDDLDVPDPGFLRGRDATEDSDLVSLRSKFMVALTNAPDGLTRVGLSDATRTNYGKWRNYRDRVLNHLLQTNVIVRIGTEKRGRYYLTENTPEDFVREDERVRQVYETVFDSGPLSRSKLMSIVGNDSINGRRVVQDILDRLVSDSYLRTSTNVRGFVLYEVA